MKIIYIHHGNRKKGNPPTQNDDLTKIGYKDCKLVANLLNNDEIKEKAVAIYTSPYFRCIKTAQIINKKIKLPIIEDERLNEFDSRKENWIELQNRVDDCINTILKKYNNDKIVICVTSGVNIVAFMNKAYNLPASNNAPFIGVPNCCPIVFDFKK